MGSPVVFNGKFSKLLTSRGIMNQNGSVNENDGNKNYLYNPSFENGTANNWSLFNTTLTSGLPTGSVTAGASSLNALAVTTTNPITGSYSLQLSSAGAVTAGQGFISDAFTIDRGDQAKVLFAKYLYEVVSGASNLNFSGTLGSQSIAAYIYDVTNSAWIQPSGFLGMNQSSGPATSSTISFQTASVGNGNTYRLAIVFLQASAGAVTINFDSFQLGPQSLSTGPAMSDWVAYTPTFTGFGTCTTVNFKSRRVGDSLEVVGYFTTGTTTAVLNAINIGYNGGNGNVTIDTTKINASGLCGMAGLATASTTYFGAGVLAADAATNSVTLSIQNSSTSILNSTLAGSSFPSSSVIEVFFTVPILGWSSNSVQSSDTDTRVISWNGTQSSQAVTANTTDIAFTSINDRSGSWNGTQFKVPVSGDYLICGGTVLSVGGASCVVYLNGSIYNSGFWTTAANASYATSGSILLTNLKANDVISLRSNTSLTVTNGTIGIFRLSGPAVVQATESVNARYTFVGAGAIAAAANVNLSNTYATFTKSYDSHGWFNPTTGLYTVGVPGKFRVTSTIAYTATPTSAPALEIMYNGNTVNSAYGNVAGNSYGATVVSDTVNCLAGDTIGLAVYNQNSSTVTISSTSHLSLAIERVGN